ncbi:MAG TPA: MgtC/SapB family protein [Candidatus Paceibacterota bacterium]|nr:MgtC/SapB family protein [Candidatus Paceibacterota bacterium]
MVSMLHQYFQISHWFGPLELHFAAAMAWAIVLGYLIGAERELRGKDAGISTHILVIIGATVFTLAGSFDITGPTRIAANVVTGIGFLGAGLIFHIEGGVKNLTTASSLWVAAALGVALGFGLYAIAVVASILTALIPRIPKIRRKANQ